MTKSLNFFVSRLPSSDKVLTDRIRHSVLSDVDPVPAAPETRSNGSLLGLSLNDLASRKKRVNLRLVVVGNSSTSLGILSHLLSLEDLIFNNIVLLSSEFIEQRRFLNVSPSEKCSEPSQLETLFLHEKVKLVQGEMEALDRKHRSISIRDANGAKHEMHYDYLVITTGLVDKTRDFLNQGRVLSNVFVTELEKEGSSKELMNLSSKTSANLSMHQATSQSTHYAPDRARKLSINGSPEALPAQNFQTMLSQKSKQAPISSRNNFSNHSNVPQEDDQLSPNTFHSTLSTDFFVSVDDARADILRRILAKRPGAEASLLKKKDLFEILEKDRGWVGRLLHKKIPQNATLYGESPKIFALLESLLADFDMDASKINLVLPLRDQFGSKPSKHSPPDSALRGCKTQMSNLASLGLETNDRLLEVLDTKVDWPIMFENAELRHFYLQILEFFGVNVIRDSEILGLCDQENSIRVSRGLAVDDQREPKEKAENVSLSATSQQRLEQQEARKNAVDPQFLEFVNHLRRFNYFFNFEKLSVDVVEDLLASNPGLSGLLDDFNLDKRLEELAKSGNEDDSSAKNLTSSISNAQPATATRKFHRKRYGLSSEINDDKDQMIQDTIVFMGRTFDVGRSVFKAIQENGLVFNGRLIVTNNFRTIDHHIYACGKISEFSQRYKNRALGRSLRVDKFDGFEVGKHFASQFVSQLRGIPFREGKGDQEPSSNEKRKTSIWTFKSRLTAFRSR